MTITAVSSAALAVVRRGPRRVLGLLVALVLALLCALTVIGASATSGAQEGGSEASVSWSVEPVRRNGTEERANFFSEAEPGERIEDAIVVRNLGTATLVLGVYASDAFNTPGGGIDLLAGDEEPVDLGSWVTVSSPAITVAPGEAIEVPFSISVPADAPSGDHAGGVVTSLTVRPDSSADTASGTAVAIERRLGTRIHVRVDGEMRPELTFRSMSATYSGTLNPFAPGEMVLSYTVENTGNVRVRARRSATVKPSIGPAVSAEAADMAELLPGNSYELTQTVTGVWPLASTSSEVELQPYEPTGAALDQAPAAAIARTSVSLVPWPQLILLAVMVVLVVWSLTRRAAGQRRLAATVDSAVRDAMASRDAGREPS